MDTSSTLASNHLNLLESPDDYDGQPPLDCYRPSLAPQQRRRQPASPTPPPLLLSATQSAAEAATAVAVRKRGRPLAPMGVLRISTLLLLSHCIIFSTLHEAYALPIVTTLRAQGPRGAVARMFAQGSISEQPSRHHHHYVSLVGSGQQRLLKKSQNPQWEDLGWAWGKRSDPKAAAQWDDLGWAWGKRSESSHVAGGKGSGTEWEDLGWAWGKRSAGPAERLSLKHNQQQNMSPTQFRAIQSLSKKNPDWHDLGWAWGR